MPNPNALAQDALPPDASAPFGRRVLVLLVYVGLLQAYGYYIGTYFSSEGYQSNAPDPLMEFFAVVLGIWSLRMSPKSLRKPSDAILCLIFYFIIIPSLFIPLVMFSLDLLTGLGTMVALSMAYALLARTPRFDLPGVQSPQSWTPYAATLATLTLACNYILISQFGFELTLVDLTDVYGRRAEFSEALTSSGDLASQYVILWLSYAIYPMLMAEGLSFWSARRYRRGFALFLASTLGQLYIFTVAGYKSVFLSPIAVIALWLLFRHRPGVHHIPLGAMAVGLFSALLYFIDFDSFTFLHLLRRSIALPGMLYGAYMDFFSTNELFFLSHSVLGSLVTNPYGSLTPAYLLGSHLFGTANTSANANMWADMFANFGYAGFFVAAAFQWVVLSLVDITSKGKKLAFCVASLGMLIYASANTGMFTTMLSYGQFITLLLLWLRPSESKDPA